MTGVVVLPEDGYGGATPFHAIALVASVLAPIILVMLGISELAQWLG